MFGWLHKAIGDILFNQSVMVEKEDIAFGKLDRILLHVIKLRNELGELKMAKDANQALGFVSASLSVLRSDIHHINDELDKLDKEGVDVSAITSAVDNLWTLGQQIELAANPELPTPEFSEIPVDTGPENPPTDQDGQQNGNPELLES